MSFVAVPPDTWAPTLWRNSIAPAFASTLVIDATGEKIAVLGRVWFPARTGTKDIRRVCLRWGAVTKAGGSALTISLQNWAAATSPLVPDETQDQTVAVANADAAFVANTWYRSGTLSADRTVSFGEKLAVVVEYDGAGRLGADSVVISTVSALSNQNWLQTVAALKTGTWAAIAVIPVVALEFSDGTFGTLDGSLPISAVNAHAYDNADTPDEYALRFAFPVPVKIDGLAALVSVTTTTASFDIVLYEGTTALVTTTIDPAAVAVNNSTRPIMIPIAEQTLTANTVYYLSIKPTQGTQNVAAYSTDVGDANYWSVLGGTDFHYATRVNAGAWSATTTRRLQAAVRLSAMHDGSGGGGIGGRVIGLGGTVIRGAA